MKTTIYTQDEFNAVIDAETESGEVTYNDEEVIIVKRVIDGLDFITADLSTCCKNARTAVKRLSKALEAAGYENVYDWIVVYDGIAAREMITDYHGGHCDGSGFWYDIECTVPELDIWYITVTFMV